ncbi:MAG: AAA family ATPase, partial [Candidatus Eisenbacteria bacterium]|nr:AAA family ATPase [Candidatus Eisenbacteria bacterium]
MRILAIRGRNLASLAGDFEVDFRSAPLAAAGIFAICGPTGSGKSTLLDALCLALYNETPRLARSHTKGIELPDVGSETMTPADPRSVLRRGCTEGFAEVDFEGCDGVACRARWSVRRARGRASGKLQQSEMTIERIGDGQRLGDQKREVLDEIQKRVGLTFDQFTRAVLLAQNEFASFLQADDNDRAELLERLTGTERFSELSKRAFERAKAEVAAVTTLERRIEGEAPLAEEQRASLVENHRAASEECEALQREIDELQGYLRWHEDGARLAEKEDQAGTAARDAHERVRLTQPDRDRLARVEEARAARPLLAGLVREEKAEASAVAQAAERRKELEDSAASKEAAERTLEAAERAAQDACSARDDAKTEIDKARELDGTLAPLRSEKETRERGLEKLRAEKNEAENAQAEAAARLRTAKERQERAGRWIEEHERIRPIAES